MYVEAVKVAICFSEITKVFKRSITHRINRPLDTQWQHLVRLLCISHGYSRCTIFFYQITVNSSRNLYKYLQIDFKFYRYNRVSGQPNFDTFYITDSTFT